MSKQNICVLGKVQGNVQGVWFRRFVQQCAEPLGVTGYAENQADGGVEVLLCGNAEAVTQVQQQVAVGPPDAEVTEVQWRDHDLLTNREFLVR